ncbi:hypothetical protein A0J48_016505 [Sphaerospermopsis aphanizomenoides BCCUSP55]|uniref:hypothetical protein n=1 Tax=Sphaerospermopsis aphanizomenoides TaxID=459663 RepID=UPI000A6B7404|nr:hypothetical protein [Sphaerospermopsis aphanizomenoides]MBK1989120.1 hypothetical protein [Sphaerospermopsis aphanizomenoides BCCUSP55]
MTIKFFLPFIAATFLYSGLVSAEARKPKAVTPPKTTPLPQIVQPQWKVFTPPDKGFQVLMPGRPKTKTQVQKTYMGEIKLEIFVAQPPEQEVAYLVTYNEFPYSYAKMTSAQKILSQAQSNTLKATQSNLISERNIRSSNGHPGKEIQYIDSAGKVTTNRMFVAEGRLYQVMAIVSKKQRPTLAKTIAGYLNSFQLVLRR